MQRFFFAHGAGAHKTVFEYARGRFTEIFDGDKGNSRTDIQLYSESVDAEFVDYVDRLVNYSCDGRAADMEALENKKTFIEFLSFLNIYLEKVRLTKEQNDKLNRKTY